jgi:hypothetical protein
VCSSDLVLFNGDGNNARIVYKRFRLTCLILLNVAVTE